MAAITICSDFGTQKIKSGTLNAYLLWICNTSESFFCIYCCCLFVGFYFSFAFDKPLLPSDKEGKIIGICKMSTLHTSTAMMYWAG